MGSEKVHSELKRLHVLYKCEFCLPVGKHIAKAELSEVVLVEDLQEFLFVLCTVFIPEI